MSSYAELLSEDNLNRLKSNRIFRGLSDSDIIRFVHIAAPDYMELEPEQTVTLEPGGKRKLGVVLEGDVKVFTVDYAGNRSVINLQRERGSVGTMQFVVDRYNVLYELVAGEASKLVMIDPDVVMVADERIVAVQHRILVNIMRSQRQLFIDLSEHLVCLSQKNIREKVLRFLQIKSEQAHAYAFDVPLSREEMAVYLAVDRAALSRSLGALKREGVIDFHRRHFEILDTKYFHY